MVKIASFSCAVAMAVTAAFSAATPSAQAAASPPPKPAAPTDRQHLANLATTLAKHLGDNRSAGSYFDKATGRLIVTVTDNSAAQSVRAADATPRMVAHSHADLTRATDELDRSARIPGTAWAIDPATDQVVISADKSVKGSKLTKLKSVANKLGASARIVPLNGKLSTLDGPTMLDGTAIYAGVSGGTARCSLGFNVFNGARHFFITAGHCTHLSPTWYANQGLTSRLGSNSGHANVFGAGGDYGVVEYDTAGIHVWGTVAGTRQFIAGSGDAFVGEAVQHSGSTTGVRGGTVTALNVTVTYGSGETVNGLTQTTACAEPGDSGGPFYDSATGLGMLSGGSGNCSIGGTTFYQPVTPILRDFAFTLWDRPQP
ncbi:S1 family peptidase [Actinoallomurus purpureus]|uniref:S1 family peptidase n=1 Tax=Actinoallomurus purpureus TaxID=478114 RepID=UPI002092FC53|nr:S1 family peptidase [Actinoallomurus purpureus]MCO6008148.1 S1 family peptidase [Actinoallomurus purpureus]